MQLDNNFWLTQTYDAKRQIKKVKRTSDSFADDSHSDDNQSSPYNFQEALKEFLDKEVH